MKKFLLSIICCSSLILLLSGIGYTYVSAQPHNATVIPTTVKVFFPKTSDPAFDHVYSVTRFVTPPATATYAEQLVIGGPTLSEQSAYGVYSEVNEILTGVSNCQHRDFKIAANKKGPKPETGTFTYQFCRDTQSAGVGQDARIMSQIKATLFQFSTVKKVVILTKGGHCFGDESGQDHCLQ